MCYHFIKLWKGTFISRLPPHKSSWASSLRRRTFNSTAMAVRYILSSHSLCGDGGGGGGEARIAPMKVRILRLRETFRQEEFTPEKVQLLRPFIFWLLEINSESYYSLSIGSKDCPVIEAICFDHFNGVITKQENFRSKSSFSKLLKVQLFLE